MSSFLCRRYWHRVWWRPLSPSWMFGTPLPALKTMQTCSVDWGRASTAPRHDAAGRSWPPGLPDQTSSLRMWWRGGRDVPNDVEVLWERLDVCAGNVEARKVYRPFGELKTCLGWERCQSVTHVCPSRVRKLIVLRRVPFHILLLGIETYWITIILMLPLLSRWNWIDVFIHFYVAIQSCLVIVLEGQYIYFLCINTMHRYNFLLIC